MLKGLRRVLLLATMGLGTLVSGACSSGEAESSGAAPSTMPGEGEAKGSVAVDVVERWLAGEPDEFTEAYLRAVRATLTPAELDYMARLDLVAMTPQAFFGDAVIRRLFEIAAEVAEKSAGGSGASTLALGRPSFTRPQVSGASGCDVPEKTRQHLAKAAAKIVIGTIIAVEAAPMLVVAVGVAVALDGVADTGVSVSVPIFGKIMKEFSILGTACASDCDAASECGERGQDYNPTTCRCSDDALCGGIDQGCCAAQPFCNQGTCQQGRCQPVACGMAVGARCCAAAAPCASGLVCQSGACAKDDGGPCGSIGQECCDVAPPCGDGLQCEGGSCEPCGNAGQACCEGGTACRAELSCLEGRCETCGDPGRRCCPGDVCQGGATCQNDRCEGCGGAQEPCCGGNTPCATGLACSELLCQECGAEGEPCCDGSCSGALMCDLNGRCSSCGDHGDPCCPGGECNGALACNGATCGPCGKSGLACCDTGTPCTDGTECSENVCRTCGETGATCCEGATPCRSPDDTCNPQNRCEECGRLDAACCDGGECTESLTKCGPSNECESCGEEGRECCDGDICLAGTTCVGPVCVACGQTGGQCCPQGPKPCATGYCDENDICQICGRSGEQCCPPEQGALCEGELSCEHALNDPAGPKSCQVCGVSGGPCCEGAEKCGAGLRCNADSYCIDHEVWWGRFKVVTIGGCATQSASACQTSVGRATRQPSGSDNPAVAPSFKLAPLSEFHNFRRETEFGGAAGTYAGCEGITTSVDQETGFSVTSHFNGYVIQFSFTITSKTLTDLSGTFTGTVNDTIDVIPISGTWTAVRRYGALFPKCLDEPNGDCRLVASGPPPVCYTQCQEQPQSDECVWTAN